MANRAIIYRLYPTASQKLLLTKTFGCCRFVYNRLLSVQQERYKNGEKHLSRTHANNFCNRQLKPAYPFLREVDKFALTNAIYHLEDGYQRFFKHFGNFPKYKSKRKATKAYTTNSTNENIKIGEQYIKLPKLGRVKAKIHRKPKEDWLLKSATVREFGDGTYQVSVLFEYEEASVLTAPVTEEQVVGLDYKSAGLYVDSNGKCQNMPGYYRMAQMKLAKKQRKLRHKVSGSRNYQKQQKRITRVYRHISNQRKDYLHKLSAATAKQYAYVCVEDLNMRSMSNKGFGNGKSTLDNGYGMFLAMLDYKLAERGGKLVKVDKFFPSSQICHCCGCRNPEVRDLRIREWICPDCGAVHDRDTNAAINIRTEGMRLLAA